MLSLLDWEKNYYEYLFLKKYASLIAAFSICSVSQKVSAVLEDDERHRQHVARCSRSHRHLFPCVYIGNTFSLSEYTYIYLFFSFFFYLQASVNSAM